MDQVQKYIKSSGFQVLGQNFDLECKMTLEVPLSRADAFVKAISEKVSYISTF